MELHAGDVERAMPDRHDLAVVRVGDRLELVWQASRGERVIPPGVERLGEPGEEPGPVVPYGACLPVQELACVPHLAAERLDDRLVSEADAERRRPGCEPADDLDRGTRVRRPAGTG